MEVFVSHVAPTQGHEDPHEDLRAAPGDDDRAHPDHRRTSAGKASRPRVTSFPSKGTKGLQVCGGVNAELRIQASLLEYRSLESNTDL